VQFITVVAQDTDHADSNVAGSAGLIGWVNWVKWIMFH
jgi:hypothetical protein